MAIVPTSSQQSIAAADVWSANLDDPAALADQAIQEGVSTEWDFGEFGKQAANALVDVTSYLPDFVGTLIGWMDQDYDESDWESTGERMFHNAGQGMRDWADKAFQLITSLLVLTKHYRLGTKAILEICLGS